MNSKSIGLWRHTATVSMGMQQFCGRRAGFGIVKVMRKHEPLAQRIRELRQDLGWTQQQLSSESGLSRSYISRLEMGDIALPSNGRLKMLAVALQTKTDDLLRAAGFLDMAENEAELPEIKAYLRERYGIREPHLLHAIEVLVEGLQSSDGEED